MLLSDTVVRNAYGQTAKLALRPWRYRCTAIGSGPRWTWLWKEVVRAGAVRLL